LTEAVVTVPPLTMLQAAVTQTVCVRDSSGYSCSGPVDRAARVKNAVHGAASAGTPKSMAGGRRQRADVKVEERFIFSGIMIAIIMRFLCCRYVAPRSNQ